MAAGITCKSIIQLNCPPPFLNAGDLHKFRCDCFITISNANANRFSAVARLEFREGGNVLDSSESDIKVPGTDTFSDSFVLATDYHCTSGDKIVVLRVTIFDKSNPQDIVRQDWKDCPFNVQ